MLFENIKAIFVNSVNIFTAKDAGCFAGRSFSAGLLDTGYWILDTGYWILDTGYWILDGNYFELRTANFELFQNTEFYFYYLCNPIKHIMPHTSNIGKWYKKSWKGLFECWIF